MSGLQLTHAGKMRLWVICGIMAVFASGEGSKMVVRVYTEKQAYAAGTEITFLAMTEEPDPLEFQWDFGNRQPVRTSSRAITKKFHLPKRYNISVRVFSGQMSAVSDVYAVIVQRAIKPNKLQFQPSVLVNTTVEFKCRVSAGSDVTYLWSFGDGTTRHGWRTEQHVFDRLGEFVVGVTMHNLVSSASLNDHIFVTSEHCLPPPVKNMGPHKIQVQRDQSVRLAVTYEAVEIQCDMYQGLQYTWMAYDSSGSQIQLASVETHKQNIELPAFFLHYGIYRAVAKVQIKGSVVYSNYSVCVEVGPRPPISIIQGATNLFISRHDTLITLNGEQSHDPDFPQIPLSYSWHCRPLSRTEGRCFQESLQLVPRSLPQLVFPVSALNPTFDQFKFTLTVQSGGRSSSSEMFVTITPNTMRNLQNNCGHCQGTGVNWNEQFSAEAFFEKDTFVSEDVVFSWKLYIVNGTHRFISEVPFCRSADQGTPAKIIESPNYTQEAVELYEGSSSPYELHMPASPTPSFESIHKTTFDDFSEFLPESINIPEHQVPDALQSDSTGRGGGPRAPTARMKPRGTHGHSPAPSAPRGSYEEGEALVSWGRWRTEGKPAEAQTLPADQPDEVTQRLGDVWNARQSPGDYDDASDLVLMGETDSHLSGIPVIFEEGGSGAPAENDSDRPLTREHHRATGEPDLLRTGHSDYPAEEETSSAHFDLTDYDFPFIGIEEGDSGTYAGRPTGVGFAWENGGRDLVSEPDHPEESFLMDSKHPGLAVAERTLLDLARELVDPVVLESHTVAGISSSVITLKPYSLSPNRHYMLAVTASERRTAVGKSQLFFTTLPAAAPEGMACLVQPSEGLELLTLFSVFCASGREDLLYKYSYTVGKSPAVVLYEGRDFQHYFHLPSGGHENDYTVTVYTVIENKYGATTKACAATVKVLPRFQRSVPLSHAPEQDLLAYATRNLSRLTQMGSVRDVQNAVSLLAGVLGRLRQEPVSSQELLGATHNALVTALCCLTPRDERLLAQNINILTDLMEVTDQVTLHSAKLLIKHIQDLSALFPKERGSGDVPSLEKRVVNAFVSVLSHTLTALRRFSKEGIELTSDVLRTITDVSLKDMTLSRASECFLNTSFLEIKTWRCDQLPTNSFSIGPATFHHPVGMDTFIAGLRDGLNSCLISQLWHFKQNPYYWGKTPVELTGDIADLRLYHCTTWRKIRTARASEVTLLHGEVNVHQFNVTPELLSQAMQATVVFRRPANRTFTIMLLFRMSERPTPVLYSMKRMHQWDGDTVHMLFPSSHLQDGGIGYVSILSADYGKTSRNKYVAPSVNYTLQIESVHCLSWDGQREWTHEDCTPQPGSSHVRINCSCSHLSPLTVAYGAVQSHVDVGDAAVYAMPSNNLTLSWVIALSLVAYALMLMVCKRADGRCERSEAPHVLPDCAPLHQQLYSVTIDTGLRSRSIMTAKVYLVLYGEEAVSETKELYIPERSLFARNSKDTFILSTAERLGSIWKVRLWHDSAGPSPSWYVSHVLVRELPSWSSWLFLGECWLAVDEHDGKVERKLTVCKQGLGLGQLLYMKLTEYLEDVHPWFSVFSCPPRGAFTRVQRLTVCLLLHLGCMCASAALVDGQHEPGVMDVSMVTGLLSALSVLPAGFLISLLFRLGQVSVHTTDVYHLSTTTHTQCNVLLTSSHLKNTLSTVSIVILAPGMRLNLLVLLIFQQSDKRKKSARRLFKDCSVSDISTVEVYQDAFHEGLCEPRSSQGNQSLAQEAWSDRYEHNTGRLGYAAASVHSHKRALGTPDSISISFDGSKMPSENFKDSLQSSPSSERGCSFKPPVLGWCFYVAWSLCLCLCVTSAVLTGILGLKFSPTKSLLWTYSLLFSVLTCAFVICPALIFMVAVVVSMWWRNRSDFFDVSSQTKSIVEAHKYWMQSGRSSVLGLHNQSMTRSTYFDTVVQARQRVRYLRLARPPSPDLLRRTFKRLRKTTLIRRFLSEVSLYVAMLVLLLFVAHGKSCNNKYRLTQAIKTQLRRGPYEHFQSIRDHQEWWNWTSSVLLAELYKSPWSDSASRENRWQTVVEANILIGELILKKTETVRNEMYSKLGEFVITSNSQNLFGKTGCDARTQSTVSLGQTRSAARATLTHLKASDWLGQHTRAVAAQFVLYHPPSGFFSTVTLQAEWGLAGVLRLRAGVESTRLLLSTGALDCARVTAEVRPLILSLPGQMCLIYSHSSLLWGGGKFFFFNPFPLEQFPERLNCSIPLNTTAFTFLSTVALLLDRDGSNDFPNMDHLSEWTAPLLFRPEKLAGSIIMMSILYYICFAYHFTLKSEKIDQMLREDFKVFIDLENITFWEELTVSLHGVVSFLFLLKSLFILGMHEAMCLPVHALKTVLSNLTWPMMAGAILVMALSSMGTLLLHHSSHAYSSLLRSVTAVLAYTIGPRGWKKWFEWKCSGCIYGLLFLGSLVCVVSWAWTAVIKGMVTSLVNTNKRTIRRKQRLTMSELGHYITNKMSALVGQGRTNWSEDHHFINTFSLEEFEDLVDELLFKLSAFSNSLHHTLPSKDPASESPVSLLSGWNSNFESEVSLQDYPPTDDIMMPPIKQSDKHESGQMSAFTGDMLQMD
ncbi:polycystic kidney disease 1 like 1 [Alosa sapidissima]|uniref:polycystic kidney disease 1 like 1 n=1 Tax=Alosa sapidissima TaxID=34773 RepID=UPI001C088919|nr:polycystic kidney disease 1 like 1 [Alosa sapidissima]